LFDGLTAEQSRKFAPLPALTLAKRKFGATALRSDSG
jgi:hypothetical protein